MAGCLALESQKTSKLGLGTSAASKAQLPYLALFFFSLVRLAVLDWAYIQEKWRFSDGV